MAVAPEVHGAVMFTGELATVPQLLSDNGLALDCVVEAEAWWDSWALDESEGARLRSQVYLSAAQSLLPVMGIAGIQDVLDRNAQGLEAAKAVEAIVDSETISQALARARGFHSDAWLALGEGDGEGALRMALRTADALWEVSPQQVATDLIERARETMGRNPQAASYSEEELIRIRRLVNGASEALDAGDYPRAIRRAYYACQLLGADPP